MIIGIDASNVLSGGGITHICNLLSVKELDRNDIELVIVWAGERVSRLLPQHQWLKVVHEPQLDRSLIARVWWQHQRLPQLLRDSCCDILFAPGGIFMNTIPCQVVTMARNILPFDRAEMKRFGLSWRRLRLTLLRWLQSQAFRNADGVIYPTQYAYQKISEVMSGQPKQKAIIPHGITTQFNLEPCRQKFLSNYSICRPLKLLYVSIINFYKHQWNVAEAVGQLRQSGYPIIIDFVGPAYPPALKRFQKAVNRLDPEGTYLHYRGPVDHSELHNYYHQADIFVFASSCESISSIVLEGMASGLPIACSQHGPMSDLLEDAGVYFDPEKPDSIADALRLLWNNPTLRMTNACKAFERAQNYSWERCSSETFSFLAEVANMSIEGSDSKKRTSLHGTK